MRDRNYLKLLLMASASFAIFAAEAGGVTNQSSDGEIVAYEALQAIPRSRVSVPDETIEALEYPPGSETILAYTFDANGDEEVDYIVASPGGILCGTGGCPYVLVDGGSGVALGEFFGTVAILNTTMNGYRAVQVLSKRDLESATLQTYVFNGKAYQLVSTALLQERGIAEWRRGFTEASRPRPSGL